MWPRSKTPRIETPTSTHSSPRGGKRGGRGGYRKRLASPREDSADYLVPRDLCAATYNSDLTLSAVSCTNILEVVGHIRALHEDARLLVAAQYLSKVESVLSRPENATLKEVRAAADLLNGELKESFQELKAQASECRATLQDWNSTDWNVAQTFMGVTTSFKHDPNGSLWVKLNGVMEDVQVFNQLATVREVDLFDMWVPFCNRSYLLKRLGRVELLSYFNTSIPGLSRDCIIHAYACDCILEENCILIQGKSVEDWEGVDFPEVSGWGHDRMVVLGFKARIEMISPTSASTSLVANVDPKTPLPQALINFVMKRMAGMLLHFLVKAAKRISVDPGNLHRHRIQEDTEFYRDWMLPKFQYYYTTRGWAFDPPAALHGRGWNGEGETQTDADVDDTMSDSSSLHSDTRSFQSMPISRHARVKPRLSLPLLVGQAKSDGALDGSGRAPSRRKSFNLKKKWAGVVRAHKARQEKPTVEPLPQPQVEDLELDPRLLAKWKAWKEERKGMEEGNHHLPQNGSDGSGIRSRDGGGGVDRARRQQRGSIPLSTSFEMRWLVLLLAGFLGISSWSGLWRQVQASAPPGLGLAAELLVRHVALRVVLVMLGDRAFHDLQADRTRRLGTLSHAREFYMGYINQGSNLVSLALVAWSLLLGTLRALVVPFLWPWGRESGQPVVWGMAVSAAANTSGAVLVASLLLFVYVTRRML